jgi:hypothetical protein
MNCLAWAQLWALLNLIGLVCSVLGGLFLFYSLALKPSNFRLVKVGESKLAICLDDKKVIAGYGGPLVVSDEVCPDMVKTGPTPQVVANRPKLASSGVLLILIGFVLQLPAAAAAVFVKVSIPN